MTYKIGLFVPAKDDNANSEKLKGILNKNDIEELCEILEKDERFEVYKDLDIRKTIVKDGLVYNQEGFCLSDLDVYFYYFTVKGYMGIYPGSDQLEALSKTTNVIPNIKSLKIGLDKYRSHLELKRNNLPVSNFVLFNFNNIDQASKVLMEWRSVLIKPRMGNFGKGIIKIDDQSTFEEVVEFVDGMNPELEVLMEKFEESDNTKWISTTIIGDELVYGYKKRKEKFVNGWKVYDKDKKGGSVDYVDAVDVKNIALKAKKVIGADILGFDFIYSKERGYVIVDENTFPGMYPDCFEKARKGSVAEIFYKMIIKNQFPSS
jgi:glutathione synthase/RimK-type ligase-like ATP-grasp enzyme